MSAAAVDAANAAPLSGSKEMSLEEPKKMTREDWRKKKELGEQWKLGNAPAEVDEEGKDINLILLSIFLQCHGILIHQKGLL